MDGKGLFNTDDAKYDSCQFRSDINYLHNNYVQNYDNF